MKICVLSCFPDFMLKDMGGSVRVYHLTKCLAESGHEVHVVIPSDKGTFEQVDKITIHSVRGLCPVRVLTSLSRLLGALRSTSLFFYDFLFVLRTCRVVLKSKVIQIEQPWAGALIIPLIRIFRKPLIVDSHDAFQALRIKHAGILRRFLETSLEKMAYRLASVILVVSETDRDVLVRSGIGGKKIRVIPNGVDTEAFTSFLEVPNSGNQSHQMDFHRVIFVGNMNYFPNQEAVHVISSSIAPKIQSKIGNVEFLIVGRVSAKFKTGLTNLTFTGVVESVAEFLGASDVAIAPFFHGSGTRLKILEYFSCGLPVVSTTVGVEGIDVENAVHCLIEDDMNAFAVKVTTLLKDKELSVRLGKAARELVVSRYDWKKIAEQLNAVYENCF